jgi:hypothetical protein
MAKPRLRLRPQTDSIEIEKRFTTGNDPAALLEILQIACVTGLSIPAWARKAFIVAYIRASRGELKSWDDVFGRPPTRQEVVRANRELAKRDKVWNLVAEACAEGRGIGNLLFEEIGEKVGLNKTDVGRLYKEQCRFRGTPRKKRNTKKKVKSSGVK